MSYQYLCIQYKDRVVKINQWLCAERAHLWSRYSRTSRRWTLCAQDSVQRAFMVAHCWEFAQMISSASMIGTAWVWVPHLSKPHSTSVPVNIPTFFSSYSPISTSEDFLIDDSTSWHQSDHSWLLDLIERFNWHVRLSHVAGSEYCIQIFSTDEARATHPSLVDHLSFGNWWHLRQCMKCMYLWASNYLGNWTLHCIIGS